MGQLWTSYQNFRALAGPVLMLLYPLQASIMAIESRPMNAEENEQWLAYWILYSFLTLMEMLFQPLLQWIPIWYDAKLLFVMWLVSPNCQGAAFLYDKIVRGHILKKLEHITDRYKSQ
ncbi:HVA22-like protein e [Rhodamnia argentea]|uniref:HVA22-like protein n=1 Tax=Rhodamnia argentea TaxID=178133 RepID=A0A8B8Q5C2_9MYRT|nr:HVA22-like protein e [Rhodamnia argentea]